ncbi:MAG: glycoside hydrolase family 43 protein, partial [Chitinophaga sp.]
MTHLSAFFLTGAIAMTVSLNGRAQQPAIFLADPTIFADNGKFYLYGTGSSQGFLFYESNDLETWA